MRVEVATKRAFRGLYRVDMGEYFKESKVVESLMDSGWAKARSGWANVISGWAIVWSDEVMTSGWTSRQT